jgi:hypothetical protein
MIASGDRFCHSVRAMFEGEEHARRRNEQDTERTTRLHVPSSVHTSRGGMERWRRSAFLHFGLSPISHLGEGHDRVLLQRAERPPVLVPTIVAAVQDHAFKSRWQLSQFEIGQTQYRSAQQTDPIRRISMSELSIMRGQRQRSTTSSSCYGLFAETEMSALNCFRTMWHRLKISQSDTYRPELHYMRGPGPKWREKHARSAEFAS